MPLGRDSSKKLLEVPSPQHARLRLGNWVAGGRSKLDAMAEFNSVNLTTFHALRISLVPASGEPFAEIHAMRGIVVSREVV